MTRARKLTPTDHGEHRHRWAGLIQDIHGAVAGDDRAKRDRVWERAGAAMTCWTLPAPYPAGLVARLMAQAALTWSRQTDPQIIAAITPVMMQIVGLCDEQLTHAAEAAPSATATGTVGRLPYADA